VVLRNYQGRIFHYRNPTRKAQEESLAEVLRPADIATESLPDGTGFKLESEGVQNADRVVVRS